MNKVAKNYVYNLSYQVLIFIVPLIATPYVSRVLGAKGVGIFSYTNSIVQYFILFGCIGLNLYGQREIAYVQHDPQKRNVVFWELVILRVIAVSISLIVFYITLASNGQYAYVFIIMMLDILATMVDISWFFQGIEDFKKIVVRNFIIKAVSVVLIFAFVKTSDDLRLYVLCHSSTLLLGNLSMWLYMPKFVKRVHSVDLRITRHIRPTILLFLPQVATSIYTVLDKTMIGYLTGMEEEVAFYEQGQMIVKIALALITSLGTVMMPRVANLFKLDKLDEIKHYLTKSFRFAFFLSFPMMFGLMAVSCSIVPWFFGPKYDKVIPNMVVIAPILVFIGLSNIIGIQFLLPVGRQKQYTLSVVTGCIVNCCLNILLIPPLLSIGAAMATVIAEFSVTAVQIYYTRQDFYMKDIIYTNSKYIICSAMMFCPTYWLAKTLTPTILHSAICVAVGGIIYFGILLFMKDDTLLTITGKIKSKILKR